MAASRSIVQVEPEPFSGTGLSVRNKYSIFNLLRHSVTGHSNWPEAWRSPDPRPEYDVVSVSGADHAQTFIARCRLQDPERAVDGQGAGRRKAEQDAARQMLAVLTRTDS